jgi:hypothetical protein
MLSRFNSLEISCLSRKVKIFGKRERSLGEYFDVCRPALRTTTHRLPRTMPTRAGTTPSTAQLRWNDHLPLTRHLRWRQYPVINYHGLGMTINQLTGQRNSSGWTLARSGTARRRRCGWPDLVSSLALNNRQPELLFLSVCSAMYNG